MPDFHLPPADGYLVALSGGADSRLLLELTVRAALLRRPDRPAGETVTAAHLHHGMRGAEADRDEAFCRAVCASLGVPLVVGQADIPALAAASGRSPETEAREVRYAFLARVMTERSISVLLTAHHADDQLETVLHHLLRGSGTRGMGGIPATRSLDSAARCDGTDPADRLSHIDTDGVEGILARRHPGNAPISGRIDEENRSFATIVFRPLLHWTRQDILTACADEGLDYVTDSSNLIADCTRNRLRLEVIPALEAIAGVGIPQRAVGRLAAAAREDDEALTAIARERYETMTRTDASADLSVSAVQAEPAAIAKRMIGLAYTAFYHRMGDFHHDADRGTTVAQPQGNRSSVAPNFTETTEIAAPASAVAPDRTLSAYHLQALLALCREGREGAVSDLLPGDVRAELRGGRLVFCPPLRGAASTTSPAEAAHRDAMPWDSTPSVLREGRTVWRGMSEVTSDAAYRREEGVSFRLEMTRLAAPCAPDRGPDVWASAVFPAAALPETLLLRARRQGDTILSHGMSKKIKKLLCDKHIQTDLRAILPIVCLPDGTPLWVPGVAFRDGYAPPEAGEAIRITVRILKNEA